MEPGPCHTSNFLEDRKRALSSTPAPCSRPGRSLYLSPMHLPRMESTDDVWSQLSSTRPQAEHTPGKVC